MLLHAVFPGASLPPYWTEGATRPTDTCWSSWAVLSERFQYILNGNGDEELYDIVEDYEQTTNLAGEPEFHPEMVRFRAALDSILGKAEQRGS